MAILLTAAMVMGIAACGNQSESNEEAAKIYQEDRQDVKIDIVEVGDVWNAYVGSLNMYIAYRLRACLKNHFRNLQTYQCIVMQKK